MRRRILPAGSRLTAAVPPVVLALGATLAAVPAATPSSGASSARVERSERTGVEPGNCRVSAELVPTCGAWLGVGANPYGGESYDQAMVNFEAPSGAPWTSRTTTSEAKPFRSPPRAWSRGRTSLAASDYC